MKIYQLASEKLKHYSHMHNSLSLCNSIKSKKKNFRTKNICSLNLIRSRLDKDGDKLTTDYKLEIIRIVSDTGFAETFVDQYGPIVKQSERIERYIRLLLNSFLYVTECLADRVANLRIPLFRGARHF